MSIYWKSDNWKEGEEAFNRGGRYGYDVDKHDQYTNEDYYKGFNDARRREECRKEEREQEEMRLEEEERTRYQELLDRDYDQYLDRQYEEQLARQQEQF
jgi:hypothetical protein